MKICTKCKVEKSLNNYSKSKRNKSGLRAQCKECDRSYRSDNEKSIKEYQKKYSYENIEKSIKYHKKYRLKNREYLRKKSKAIRIRDADIIKLRSKVYYKENKEIILEKNRLYRENNKDYLRENQRAYKKKRRASEPLYKLECNIRRLIQISLSNNSTEKSLKTREILGCSIKHFKKHIDSKLEPWMNWENRGLFNGKESYGWDLDHIVPISSYKNKEELIELNHYTNFQPLCSKINRCIKRDKIWTKP